MVNFLKHVLMGIKIDIGDGDGGATYVNYASTDSGSTTSTTYKEDSESRPYRRVGQRSKPAGDKAVSLYGKDNTKTVIWGSDSHSFFLDVVSIGPIGAVHAAYFNDSDVNNGEFPLSTLSSHDGTTEELPWNGDFPYVERSVSIGKVAEILDKRHTKRTTVTKQVTGLGVRAVRVNFITSAFKQLDDKGRKKAAQAIFQIYSYDASGAQVQIDTYPHTDFYCEGPTMIELTATPPTSLADQIWSYQVVMKIQGNNHGVLVQGSWSASTATEIVIDTQTYQDIAYVSGDVVASDVSGKVPKRQYLVSGYKVQVPDIVNDVYTGFFSTEVSNSHAYNAMAVITDEKWGGGRDMDSIVVTSFIDFENYCAEQIDGKRRYSHSQVLNKAENYYRTASKMVGAADGRLYQDVSGRIGVLIDRETDNRRVITSYDIEEGDMKLATVPSSKKVNYVEGTYEDKDNSYEKTIIQVRDEKAELLNGTIPKKLKLDTCTDADEALRIIKKFLAVSQLSVDTYTFNVGPSHGDIQIGEVVELYSRKYSRIDFCGKVAAGSSLTEIAVDARTPINLTGITNPILVLDNDRGVPITASISSYTSSSITLSGLSEIPTTGVSFGVRSSDASTGIQPLLCRVMDISDEGTVKRVETLAYNHSLYEHVEAGSDLIMPVTKYLPLENLGEVTSPVITKVSGGLKVDWQTNQSTWKSWVYWSVLKDNGKYEALKSQGAAAGVLTDTLVSALDTTTYKAGIAVISPDGEYTSEYATATTALGIQSGTATMPAPTLVGVDDGTQNRTLTFRGRSFTIVWSHSGHADLNYFSVEITQGGTTVEFRAEASDRDMYISEIELTDAFGSTFGRNFTLSVKAIDTALKGTAEEQANISNPAPLAPTITIEESGSLALEATTDTDVLEAVVLIWKTTDGESTAGTVTSQDLTYISVPDSLIDHDGSTYTYKAWFVDSFGDVDTNTTQDSYQFFAAAEVPEPPLLTRLIPINSTQVAVEYSHDSIFLAKTEVSYRIIGILAWTTVAIPYTFPIAVDDLTQTYDALTEIGYLQVISLPFNQEFEFRVRSANTSSIWSDYSNILTGRAFVGGLSIDDLEEELQDKLESIEDDLLNIDPRVLIVEGVVEQFAGYNTQKSVFKEVIERETENSKTVIELNILQAQFDDPNTGVFAAITDLNTVFVDSDTAMAQRVSLVEAEASGNSGSIGELNDVSITSTSALVQSYLAIKGSVEDPSTGLVAAHGSIDQLNTVDISSTSSLVIDYLSLKGAVNDPSTGLVAAYGEIAQLNNVDITSTSALVQAYLTLEGTVNDPTTGLAAASADISELNNISVTSTSALASSHASLNAQVTSSHYGLPALFSSIDELNSVSNNSDSANARSLYALNAQVDDGSTGLAAVRTEALAAYGYCKVGGAISDDTKSTCSGTWTYAGIASAIKAISVTSSQGNTTTVGATYQAIEDLNGEIVGKAMMGVTSGGEFTGLDIVGGSTISKLTFSGSTISFKSTSGVEQFYWDSSAARFTFKGHIEAATMSASTITGSDITTESFTANGGSNSVAFTVSNSITGSNALRIRVGGGTVMYTGSTSARYCTFTNGGSGTWACNISGAFLNTATSSSPSSSNYLDITTRLRSTQLSYFSGSSSNSNTTFGSYFYNRPVSFEKTITVAGGVLPFTGAHVYLVETNAPHVKGTLMRDGEFIGASEGDVSNALFTCEVTSKPRDTSAVGVVSMMAYSLIMPTDLEDGSDNSMYQPLLKTHGLDGVWADQNQLKYNLTHVNALGEGWMLVCREGGDIKKGNWLCSSSKNGHAMKQVDEDGNYIPYYADFTVAKSRLDIIWDEMLFDETLIPVFYSGG